jgi:hypothetical protein
MLLRADATRETGLSSLDPTGSRCKVDYFKGVFLDYGRIECKIDPLKISAHDVAFIRQR